LEKEKRISGFLIPLQIHLDEIQAENIIRIAYQKLLMTYLNITPFENSRSKGGRKGRCLGCNKFSHYVEYPNGMDTSLDGDNNHSKDIFNDQRNDR